MSIQENRAILVYHNIIIRHQVPRIDRNVEQYEIRLKKLLIVHILTIMSCTPDEKLIT